LTNSNISKFLSSNSINFEDLRSKKTIVYFQIPEAKVQHYIFLLNLFYSQFFDFAMTLKDKKNEKLPIYCLLDEFGNMTIPNFSTVITTIRKYKVSLSILLQSLTQLEKNY
jgi:type IV secretory pathway TraG/TraD family ATPase VirD4